MPIQRVCHLMNAKKPFSFNVNNTQIIGGLFSTSTGTAVTVEWGDGSISEYSGTDQAWLKDYGSAGNRTVKIYNDNTLLNFTMNRFGVDISFNIAKLPINLTHFYCYGNNTVFGNINNLPINLIQFYCSGNNTVSGDIAKLPINLTHFYGFGNNTVSGDIAKLPINLTQFYCSGNNTVSNYTGKIWTTKPAKFVFTPVGIGGLTSIEVDQLLIDFDDTLIWATGDIITLTGTNAARTAVSDAAVSSMVTEGAVITTN